MNRTERLMAGSDPLFLHTEFDVVGCKGSRGWYCLPCLSRMQFQDDDVLGDMDSANSYGDVAYVILDRAKRELTFYCQCCGGSVGYDLIRREM